MKKIVKENKWGIIIILLLAIAYFLLRLPNLTLQPIFADEAIYVRWAQVMKAEPTLRFLPMSDGKTPLFMWVMSPFLKMFSDPLYAGRFLSVFSGFITMLGALFLGWRFFGKTTGLWAALLIVVTPYIVFFDRMALVDSMLAALSLWSLIFALLLMENPRLDLAMFLGYIFGAGILTKPPGFFNVLVLPVSLIVFGWREKGRQLRLLKIFGLWGVAVIITLVIYNILRLGPGFVGLNSRSQDYFFSPLSVLSRPWDPFLPHLRDIIDWMPKLLTPPILILVLGGIILTAIKRNKYALVVLLWGIIPLIIQLGLLKTFTARYILFSIPPLLCLAGWVIASLAKELKWKAGVFALVILILLLPFPIYFNSKLLTDPAKALLPQEERRGYLEDWTAGYGFPEIAQFLIEKAQNGLVVVGTEGSFGTLPDGLQIYLDRYSHTAPADKQVIVLGGGATVSAQLRGAALEHPTFFVTNKLRYENPAEGLKLIKEFPKTEGNSIARDSILFFQLIPLNIK